VAADPAARGRVNRQAVTQIRLWSPMRTHSFYASLTALGILLSSATSTRALAQRNNLALGKPVTYLPAVAVPDVNTAKTRLTDGEIAPDLTQPTWWQRGVVWQFCGRSNLCVDLGSVQAIEEVAIRLLGGSPWDKTASIALPDRVIVVVSENIRGPYYKAAEYSKWLPGHDQRHNLPREAGQPFVHRMRFEDLGTKGRYVGIQFTVPTFAISDELFVYQGTHKAQGVTYKREAIHGFSVTDAQIYLHKPYVTITSNVYTPLPIGALATGDAKKPVTLKFTVPEGIALAEKGNIEFGVPPGRMTSATKDGRATYTWQFDSQLSLPRKAGQTAQCDQNFGRLFFTGSPVDKDAAPVFSHSLKWGDYQSPETTYPIRVVEVPEQPVTPKRLLLGQGWSRFPDARVWPEWDKAFRRIGYNTVSGMAPRWMVDKAENLDPELAFVNEARQKGYKIQLVGCVLDGLWPGLGEAEVRCRLEDGTAAFRLCPSYRGAVYAREMNYLTKVMALFKPDYFSQDLEFWSDGCGLPPTCTRCQADKEKSGIASWDAWKLAKGREIWRDIYTAMEKGRQQVDGPMFRVGLFNQQANHGGVYHSVWRFSDMYPDRLHAAEQRYYSALGAHHLGIVGDDIRAERRLLNGNHVTPYVPEGTFGAFPGEEFYYMMLEAFCNGAIGVMPFSNRVTDGDLLVNHARAIRAIAPVEDIVMDGDLFDAVTVRGPGRVSAKKLGDRILLLAADYWVDTDAVTLRIDLNTHVRIRDLDKQTELGALEAGKYTELRVKLGDDRAKLLLLRP